MLKVWGRPNSINVQKVMWLLRELDVAHDHVELGGDFGGLDKETYLALNPHGRVPTLTDDNVVVWESDAILRYLAARYGDESFWSADPAERAEVDQWLAWTQTALQPPWIDLFWRLVRTPSELQDAEVIGRLTRATIARFHVLDAQLEGRDYLLGRFSLADIPAGMTLFRWFEMDVERPPMPNLEGWYERLRERAAYVESACIPFDDLVGKLAY